MGSEKARQGGIVPRNLQLARPDSTGNDVELKSLELSSRRTGLSFQRTRMSTDRTLMSIIRTALSLIGFGFTIFQFFRYLHTSTGAAQMVPLTAARRFGLALVLFGLGMLIFGIWNHIAFMRQLRAERKQMVEQGLVHGEMSFPISMTLIVATLLFGIGLLAILGMALRAGPLN